MAQVFIKKDDGKLQLIGSIKDEEIKADSLVRPADGVERSCLVIGPVIVTLSSAEIMHAMCALHVAGCTAAMRELRSTIASPPADAVKH